MKRTRALLTTALPIALATALLLAGCSAGGGEANTDTDASEAGGAVTVAVQSAITKDASGKDCAAAGDAVNALSITGDFGEEVSLSSPTPVTTTGLERAVLVEGDTEPFAEGENAAVAFTLINGKTGEVVNHVAASTLPNSAESVDPAFYEATRCGALGQRVAIALPVGQALGDTTPADAGFTDLETTDSFVLVFDFTRPVDQFDGCDTIAPRDKKYPEVDLGDGSSEPKITIPSCMEAPDKLEVTVLKAGTGPVVTADESIMTNYVGVKWNGAERFDGNWSETGIEFSTAQGALIDGFTQAMIGQKIGSTILVTIPPEQAYGMSGAELSGYTLTFVLQLVAKAV